MRRPDYSIIFLKPSLAEVYEALGDSPMAEIYRRDFITLSPNEFYTQITNYPGGINLGADAKVEIVDCCDRVLLDITDKTTIVQFNHSETGKFQMIWEVVNIGQSLNKSVHLKFTQQTNPANVFYSNPFTVTDDESELRQTTRIDYRAFGVYNYTDWATPDAMCSVRVRGYFTKPDPKTGNENYLNTSGRRLMLYPTPDIPDMFQIEYQDNWGLKAFEYIRYCCPFVVYLTKWGQRYGIRATMMETASEGMLGSSNFFKASYTASVDDLDSDFIPAYQISPNFALITKIPLGVYRPDDFPSPLSGVFNMPIVLGTGTLTIHNEDGTTFATFTESDISVGGNTFSIDISSLSFPIGKYFNTFTSGLFNSESGQTYEIAFDNDAEWTFQISAGRYDLDRYDGSRYL